ncbi:MULTISPECIES: hypothetical protein [Kingella]|uniref:Uncharacterized protein n=1 Tax=Kingella bonacorsii TaxID=2796361 RepID=A0ABS1BQE9_9NEIS|nr:MULTISPECIES: hypothetical protein [Kingella]MBK0395505.1 hypothetical protein [Kingella bonacorsii]
MDKEARLPLGRYLKDWGSLKRAGLRQEWVWRRYAMCCFRLHQGLGSLKWDWATGLFSRYGLSLGAARKRIFRLPRGSCL